MNFWETIGAGLLTNGLLTLLGLWLVYRRTKITENVKYGLKKIHEGEVTEIVQRVIASVQLESQERASFREAQRNSIIKCYESITLLMSELVTTITQIMAETEKPISDHLSNTERVFSAYKRDSSLMALYCYHDKEYNQSFMRLNSKLTTAKRIQTMGVVRLNFIRHEILIAENEAEVNKADKLIQQYDHEAIDWEEKLTVSIKSLVLELDAFMKPTLERIKNVSHDLP